MLYELLKEEIKSLLTNFELITNWYEKKNIQKEYNHFLNIVKKENFWEHPDQKNIQASFSYYKEIYECFLQQKAFFTDIEEIIEACKNDATELQSIGNELKNIKKNIHSLKIKLLLSEEHDTFACFLMINPGAGGTESQDWASILLRMYLRFCEQENLSVKVLDECYADEAGIKSATLYIKGSFPYGLLKSEHGIHRLIRISPFDANKRRHTSFTAISVIPEIEKSSISIDTKDLRIDTYRASGAGGQHVNKTESAVRITHLPTNIVVSCQNERSQIANRETAMKMLKAKLQQKHDSEHKKKTEKKKDKNEWGSQIRSYILHPYKMVKDHRTNYSDHQPDLVLDGNLMPFIETYLSEDSES